MASTTDVIALLHRLKEATSLHDQLTTLVRGWRTVRALTPEQRLQLATHIGLDEAEVLLKRLGHPKGIAPVQLQQAVRKARRADPADLKKLLDGLRDPRRRGQTVRKLFEALEATLDTGPTGKDAEPTPAPASAVPSQTPAAEAAPEAAPPPAPQVSRQEKVER